MATCSSRLMAWQLRLKFKFKVSANSSSLRITSRSKQAAACCCSTPSLCHTAHSHKELGCDCGVGAMDEGGGCVLALLAMSQCCPPRRCCCCDIRSLSSGPDRSQNRRALTKAQSCGLWVMPCSEAIPGHPCPSPPSASVPLAARVLKSQAQS